ncbi:MAG: ABC transporter ATP-binding protein [Desulfobacterales bacterium]|nr:ABC transporter ATP-binding protein [Desulfobacterales bacterium]
MMPRPVSDHIVQAHQLSRVYPLGPSQVVGLDRVDLEIPTGALVVLKGASGSGKSTLLALMAALDAPTHGDLLVAGHDLKQLSETQKTAFRRKVVGMVFQSFNLLPTLSVQENVCLPALLAGAAFDATRDRAAELLDWLGMADRRQHRPAQLSGGEMQRTAIARALINQPQLVLADEPTGNLDSRNGDMVIQLLHDLNRKQACTVIIATHSDQADSLATQFIHLKDGTRIQDRGQR